MARPESRIECVVAGAGVVGLAIGAELARRGHQVAVVESEARAGEHASSRNSGVIHAGLYYPPDSLKSRLCLRGSERLYAYCARRGLAHSRCGKLIVAVEQADCTGLERLRDTASAAGVELDWLDGDQARTRAPDLHCEAALFSPNTGIVDAGELLTALVADLEDAGGVLLTCNRLSAATALSSGFRLDIDGAETVHCQRLVNSTGAGAASLASRISGLDARHVPRLRLARGHYYSLAAPSPWQHLVYPLPETGGLGIHSTLDTAGRTRFGPDVDWNLDAGYRFDESRKAAFVTAIRRYWPKLPADRLHPDCVGIRAKIQTDSGFADFRIDGSADHGIPGLVNLFGIESPGLTAALAIGTYIADRL